MIGGHHSVEVRTPGAVPLWIVLTGRLPVGRAGGGLLIDDERVSRYHCELDLVDGEVVVRDLRSSHGTLVNGHRIDGPVRVRPGDVISVGDTTIVVDPTADPAGAVGPPRTAATAAATDPAPAPTPDPAAAPTVRQAPPATVGPDGPGDGAPAAPTADARATLSASVVGGTLTIVFSDIVDSTALNDRHGDRAWFDILRRHNALVRRHLATHGGREVKGQGDGFLLTFPSPRHAALFAVDLQRALAGARVQDPAFPVHVRLGVHTGEVIVDSGDIFGWHVNMAARVAGQGGTDEVVVSALVHQILSSAGDLAFDPPRAVPLKGLEGTYLVHPLRWRQPGAPT